MNYKVGEKPGKGTYVCIYCRNNVYLDNDIDRLPPCARCEKSEFRRG